MFTFYYQFRMKFFKFSIFSEEMNSFFEKLHKMRYQMTDF